MVDKRNRATARRQDLDDDDDVVSLADPNPVAEAPSRPEFEPDDRPAIAPAPEALPPRPSRVGRRLGLIAGLLILIAAGYYAYPYYVQWRAAPATAAAPPPPAVTVAVPVLKSLIDWSEFTGQFEAVDSVEIRARVSGYLEKINFVDGQIVKKGDLLFVIEPRPFEIALEQAKTQVAQAAAQLELAKSELARTEQLRKSDFATQETYDTRLSQVNVATAALQAANAAVDQAQLNLDYTRVTAPQSGRISRHEVSIGNLIMGGIGGSTTLLTTIVSLDPIHFLFEISEADGIAYKRLVQKGELKSARDNGIQVQGQVADETDWTLKGKIDFVDNQYDTSSGTIRLRAEFPNPNLFITPGQFGRVRIPISQRHPVILVPDAAVVTDQSTKQLMVVNPDGSVTPKQVELGQLVDGNLRVIKSGIATNDRVIINGLMRVRPGVKVTPQDGKIDVPASLDTSAAP